MKPPKLSKRNLMDDKIGKNSTGDEKILYDFRVIENKHFQRTFDSALYLTTIALTFLGFAAMYTHDTVNVFYTCMGITIVLSMLVTRDLFKRFPEVLLILWRQNLFSVPIRTASAPENASSPSDEYLLGFFAATKKHLHNRIPNVMVGLLGFGIMIWAIRILDISWLRNIDFYWREYPWFIILTAWTRIVFLFTGYVCGVMGWRVLVIAFRIAMLGRKFDVNLQINHPDGCGGLGHIGDLCLTLAFCLVPFPILVGALLILVNFLDSFYLQLEPRNIQYVLSTLQALIVPLVAIDFVGFFLPPISIHNSMVRAKYRIQTKLDAISQEINDIHSYLLSKAAEIDPKEGTTYEEKIDFLKRIYGKFSTIPTWPYRGGHLLRLTTSQIIPVLGMLSSIIGFFRDMFLN